MKRILGHLRDVIEDSDIPMAEIEDRMGFRRGYLPQLLGGHIDLRYWQLVELLRVVGYDGSKFFAAVFPPPQGVQAVKAAFGDLDRDVLDVYGLGVESLQELRQRLESVEAELHRGPDRDTEDPDGDD